MYGWPAHRSISRAESSGASMATQMDPRQRSCQLFLLSSQWLACQSLSATLIAWLTSGNRAGYAAGSRIAMSAPAP